MISIGISKNTEDLEGILKLQQKNLRADLPPEEIKEQGFVTVAHSLDDLDKMHKHVPNVIVKDGDEVIAYVLGMTEKSKSDIPRLVEMYESFDHIQYKGKSVADYEYIVVGQVCIAKSYRGQGLFDSSYRAYREYFENQFAFAITEIATINLRSMKAHQRVGFETIYTYIDTSDTEWNVVVWDWRK